MHKCLSAECLWGIYIPHGCDLSALLCVINWTQLASAICHFHPACIQTEWPTPVTVGWDNRSLQSSKFHLHWPRGYGIHIHTGVITTLETQSWSAATHTRKACLSVVVVCLSVCLPVCPLLFICLSICCRYPSVCPSVCLSAQKYQFSRSRPFY